MEAIELGTTLKGATLEARRVGARTVTLNVRVYPQLVGLHFEPCRFYPEPADLP